MKHLAAAATVVLAFCLASGRSLAAIASFDDLALGSRTVPSVISSGGIPVTLVAPGFADIEGSGVVAQCMRLEFGASASFGVPAGTTEASFYYYNVIAGPTLSVNGDVLNLTSLGASGTIGSATYTHTVGPHSSFDRIDLSGAISSLVLKSAPSPNGLIIDQVAFVPEPSGVLILACGAWTNLARSRRR